MINLIIAEGVFLKPFSDGVVVYSELTGETHKLDLLTGQILCFLETSKSKGDIIAQMRTDITEQPAVNIEEFVDKALSILVKFSLVSESKRHVE